MADGDALEVLAPTATPVVVGGRALTITPLRVKQFPAVVRALRPVLGSLLAAGENIDEGVLLDLYCEHADRVNEAVAVMCGLSVTEIEELEVADALALIAQCLGANRDFFTRTLPGLFARAVSTLNPATPGAGPTT